MQLKLSNNDLRWAHWRNIPAETKPAIRPFILENALKAILSIKTRYHHINWDNLKIDIGISPEEAHFWLEAFVKSGEKWGITHQEVIDYLSQPHMRFDGKLSLKDVQTMLGTVHASNAMGGKIVIALYRLLNHPDFVAVIEKLLSNYYYLQSLPEVFRLQILPYLTDDERESLRSAMRPYLNGTNVAHIGIAGLVGGMDAEIEHYLDALYAKKASFYGAYYGPTYYAVFGLSTAEKVSHYVHRHNLYMQLPDYMTAWVAHTELSQLDWLETSIRQAYNKTHKKTAFGIFKKLPYLEVVPHVLSLMQEPELAAEALAWLVGNPELAAQALTPLAFQGNKEALKYLRRMVSMQQTEALEAVKNSLSEAEQERFCREVLEFHQHNMPEFDESNTPDWLRDAMANQGKGSKKTPVDWVDILALPPLTINGIRLNNEQVKHVLLALRGNNANFIAQMKQHFPQQELDDFAWTLYENWEDSGAASKDSWVLNTLGQIGGDTVVLKLSPLIKKWPGESKAKRAQSGIRILEEIGSDTALMQINNIAQKIRYNGLKKSARQAMEAVAKARGFTQIELEDRIIPDGGLSDGGTRIFDFGSRKFTFVLSSEMKAMIREENGKLRDNLPKPTKADDAALAAQAEADWKLIKKQIREVAKIQAERLESAMISQRRWALKDFQQLFVQHPLMFHIVRLLLWGGYDAQGQLVQSFRVDENRSFVDSADEPIETDGITTVGVLHVMELDAATQQNWGEVLSDYELIPPFQQLGRKVSKLEAGEEDAKIITRFAPYKVQPVIMVSILEKSGWRRGPAQDAGMYYSHARFYPFANLTAIVRYYGVPMGYWDYDKQGIDACFFVKGEQHPEGYASYKEENMLRLGDVPPVVLSETLRTLHAIAGKAE